MVEGFSLRAQAVVAAADAFSRTAGRATVVGVARAPACVGRLAQRRDVVAVLHPAVGDTPETLRRACATTLDEAAAAVSRGPQSRLQRVEAALGEAARARRAGEGRAVSTWCSGCCGQAPDVGRRRRSRAADGERIRELIASGF